MRDAVRSLIIAIPAVVCTVAVRAETVTFTATGRGDDPGEVLSASATFTVTNQLLVITLSNTANFDSNDSGDLLTGLFFTLPGAARLTPLSAMLAPGSSIISQRLPPGFNGNVGNQWAYSSALPGAPQGVNEGISSTSLKWFNNKNLFSSAKVKGMPNFKTVGFGLSSESDLPRNNRSTIKNQPLIIDSAVFTFYNLPADFDPKSISSVVFQYGINLKQPDLVAQMLAVPEPSSFALVTLGLLGALLLRLGFAISTSRR